ncbi:MAG: winged helix-turn-helix transcriptional regulator [Methanomicrobia archaeon]|nr:winged helix-turn-helix transcriptional regulator [Methanomicrobia archaeon]
MSTEPPKNSVPLCAPGKSCKIPPSYAISKEVLENVQAVLNEDISEEVAVFKALSDPLRVRILKALGLSDLCVCVLVELMECEYSKLSYHLGVLKKAGLVACTQDGTFQIYHLTEFGKQMIRCFRLI